MYLAGAFTSVRNARAAADSAGGRGHLWLRDGGRLRGAHRRRSDADGEKRVARGARDLRGALRGLLAGAAGNPKEVDQVALPPCHTLFQLYVQDGEFSCQLYQRSADVFLGVPFNVASYALLTRMIAHVSGLKPGDFVHTFGDAHLYKNHVEQAKLQLTRAPRKLPQLKINPGAKDLFAFRFEDFTFEGYDPHPPIAAEVSV